MRSRDQVPEDADPGAAAPHSVQQPVVDAMAMMRQMCSMLMYLHRSLKREREPRRNSTDSPATTWNYGCSVLSSITLTIARRCRFDFVDTIFGNLGPVAQTGYRDFKISLGDQPATWTIFKQRIRERFRDADFQHKMLSRLHNLRWSGSQQANTTKFLHLLSQLDCELPEVVKRWYYQQNLRSDTSAFVSQNVPSTLKEVIELAQRFEDFRATIPGPSVQRDQRGDKRQANHNLKRRTLQCRPIPVSPLILLGGMVTGLPLRYHADDAVLSTKEKVYGYLSQRGRIADAAVSIFIDSGASFNVIDAQVASSLGLPIKASSKPLNVKLGSGQ
ncbi:Aspartyl protease, partial [Phytophthora infestans]